ncbi:hypothetical protein D9757_000303 [Collybiopsis confluens]|uniref:AMP-activated protein kinase glycogen-binding domain-containing protein n=1 Tax=Collybiopsis confluens TaxID=2823264 RepID=A0A8H5MHG6_9AGAR|nr:hypothetical protein D9757_000303 [Collybiopsis confluens]
MSEKPYSEPNSVTVTGTFDQWAKSLRLVKEEDGYRGKIEVKWGEKILYKYIVDGEWVPDIQQPTEVDSAGNTNNVFIAPTKPARASHANGNGIINESKPTLESTPGEPEIAQGTSSRTLPQLVSDLATTIAATDGTSSAFNYLVSGVGAAIHGVIGIDPINPDQLSIKSPISPVPPTPYGGTPVVEDSNPTSVSAKPESAVEEKVTSEISVSDKTEISDKAELAANPSIEPSTHTPVTPAALPPSGQSPSLVDSSSSSADIVSAPNVEASTHIPIAVPVKSAVSVDTLLTASASELTPPSAAVEIAVDKSSESTAEPSVAEKPAQEVLAVQETETNKDMSSGTASAEPSATLPVVVPIPNGTSNAESVTEAPKANGVSNMAAVAASAPVEQTTLATPTEAPRTSDDSVSIPKDRSATPTPSVPSTPSGKRDSRVFPSSSSITSSPASSRFGTASSRSKRRSFFGKVKHVFSHHKGKEEEGS